MSDCSCELGIKQLQQERDDLRAEAERLREALQKINNETNSLVEERLSGAERYIRDISKKALEGEKK